MTSKDKAIIQKNLDAFTHNFGAPRIEKVPYAGYEVYYPADNGQYIQYCENIHYLDGWLYGMVQAFHRHKLLSLAYEIESGKEDVA